MDYGFAFFFNSILLGIALAMDAFSVSLANGMNEPKMKLHRMCLLSAVFALFQFAMPMTGWFCVHSIAKLFGVFEKFIPWIALILLCFIGIKMIVDSVKSKDEKSEDHSAVGFGALILQGIATSIDALSVGFTISDYTAPGAFLSCLLIGAVTFLICLGGIAIGKSAGTHLAGKAGILGGSILIFIGLEIFIKSFF